MTPSISRTGSKYWIQISLLTTVLTLVFGGLFSLSASADAVGEDLPYRVQGNVKNEGVALAGVRIVVSGGGYTAETVTDEEGKWLIGVPEKAGYSVSLDQSTLCLLYTSPSPRDS